MKLGYYELMNIGSVGNSGGPLQRNTNIQQSTSVLLGVDGKDVEVQSTQIYSMCSKFAEIAKKMGETNDEKTYADDMYESVLGAYQQVSRKRKRKRGEDEETEEDADA